MSLISSSVGGRVGKSTCCEAVARASAPDYVPPVLARILALIGLLAANAFFVAAEFSIVRSRRSRLEAMARGGDAKARLVLRATTNLARKISHRSIECPQGFLYPVVE